MTTEDQKYFDLLKTKVVETLQQSYPAVPSQIEEWKGNEIIQFQDDLMLKINEHLSEKWFYTHMKSMQEKLPRIDILNILSHYVGYIDWLDFKYRNGKTRNFKSRKDKSNLYFIGVPVIVVLLLTILILFSKFFYTREYSFCFIDADTREPVNKHPIEISILYDTQSPVTVLCDSSGCFSVKTAERKLRFVARIPYYKTDTITRLLDKFNRHELISIRADYYAMMIQFFSHSKVEDWEKRRENLDRIFSDNAMIYQVYDDGDIGMDLYNKWEFINKITMPSRSLKNVEILDTEYTGDRISTLKFRQIDK